MTAITGATRTVDAVTSDDTAALVRTRGLTKRFRRAVVVDDVALIVPQGAVYGFLGPNGSGKTTTIRMLLGLVRPVAGRSSCSAYRSRPGGRRAAPGRLAGRGTGVPSLSLRARESGPAGRGRRDRRPRSARQRDRLGTGPGRPAGCRGQALPRVLPRDAAAARHRQRAAQPRELLVLDEPTNGLDPQGTREVRHLIAQLAEEGDTVLRVQPPAHRGGADLHATSASCATGGSSAQGTHGGAARRRRHTVRVETDRPTAAARMLRSGAQRGGGRFRRNVTARLGEVSPETIVAALVAAGLAVSDSPWRHRAWKTCSCPSPGRASMSAAERRDLGRGPADTAGSTGRAAEPWAAAAGPLPRVGAGAHPGRRRNRDGTPVLAVVPIIIAVSVRLSSDRSAGGPDFRHAITGTGCSSRLPR